MICFRYCNLLGIFQRMINAIFREIIYSNELANYMNDFVIPGKTQKELKNKTTKFLKIIEQHNLCFKKSKCKFNTIEISILGVKVENKMI